MVTKSPRLSGFAANLESWIILSSGGVIHGHIQLHVGLRLGLDAGGDLFCFHGFIP